MNHFEYFQALTLNKILADWPNNAPEGFSHMTVEQAFRALLEFHKTDPMPDAELTPEMVPAMNAARLQIKTAYEAFLKMGRSFLEIRSKKTEAEFWSFVRQCTPASQIEALLSMEAAKQAQD